MHKIPVFLQQDRGFIYNVDDYLELRYTHRIVGCLIGVPVSKSRNVNISALPAVLSRYEMKLAIEKQIITVHNRTAELMQSPKEKNKSSYHNLIEKQASEQRAPYVEKRLSEFKKLLPQIIEGKRKKFLKAGSKDSDIHIDPATLIFEEKQKIETAAITRLIQIPMKHPILKEPSSTTLLLSAGEQVKYKVFKDIWEKQKMYITGGDTFGCDFLLYPGDPLYYHASHMVHVLKNSNLKTNLKYLIRCCRLSVVVNKVCVFAYENCQGTICYQTMEWEGNTFCIT
ncbi:tRNA-splicing endonuclease subunit Sen34 [Wyeomyia smithii]|uniref:tRNA-splicing endonuclease subunit Sen34 n=1 Tax=Wyeomyia smithii TaxID=174621 RepID=UPI0024680614|nr:tRNA-splicing endonuclease subunit Sen34 [Wyeomyia smithii]